ncbi:MAG: PaaI family thioesterase [Acidobacteriota bacterium]|nr:PaaI family thioesterase [Acidobacteriota bacterium]
MPVMNAAELEAFAQAQFPQMEGFGFRIEQVEDKFLRIRLLYHARHLRPGGTISGPALMTLADMATYFAVLSMIGPVALAVTTSLNINFLRKPAQVDVIAECRLLKLGSRLAVGQVLMFSDGEDEPVAQATVTYSIPPNQNEFRER